MDNNQNSQEQVITEVSKQPTNNKKMKKCKACGADISKSAKNCPHCGAKNKKHKLFAIILIIVGVVIIATAIGSGNEEGSSKSSGNKSGNTVVEEAPKEYRKVNVIDLFKAIESNAAKAQKDYEDTYVEISGYIDNIDASGDYIGIGASQDNYDYMFDSVQCYIQNEEQLNQVMEMSKGDYITVKGKIITVGEVMGYSLNIDSIVK